ncbi:POU domain class 2-associating factor 1 isoform X2 [Thalassophryne amazonica]|uniref:POU domain class 2-associating factor 1 isoform X2 n=1 Tax=Thalassophryne amazonica TaxID=390379 RepID=UPI001471F694|nr:POU domain class 2-associating factor 1 isoform X2 [Thalassophryne amazonica]
MHWEKSPPSAPARSRPYQGVRVRDPVKELLRRKRNLQFHSTKTAPSTVDAGHQNHQTLYTQGVFGSDGPVSSPAETSPSGNDRGLQCAGWKAPPPTTNPGLQPAVPTWTSPNGNQREPSAQALAYPGTTALTADMYMPTLCPSYTMLTYTHTPLLTNFGTIPMAPAPSSFPQMDLKDSGMTYLPWAQPLNTISTMSSTGVQFTPGSASLPGTPLVHMPLSMSLTTVIPQLEAQSVDSHLQILDLPQCSDHQLNRETQAQSLDDDSGIEPESPNLLDKLLDQKDAEEEQECKSFYSSSFFLASD